MNVCTLIGPLKVAQCKCDICASLCQDNPGWFLPGQVAVAAEALNMSEQEFFERFCIVEYWAGDPRPQEAINADATSEELKLKSTSWRYVEENKYSDWINVYVIAPRRFIQDEDFTNESRVASYRVNMGDGGACKMLKTWSDGVVATSWVTSPEECGCRLDVLTRPIECSTTWGCKDKVGASRRDIAVAWMDYQEEVVRISQVENLRWRGTML